MRFQGKLSLLMSLLLPILLERFDLVLESTLALRELLLLLVGF